MITHTKIKLINQNDSRNISGDYVFANLWGILATMILIMNKQASYSSYLKISNGSFSTHHDYMHYSSTLRHNFKFNKRSKFPNLEK